jgi:hypothetical protein
MNIPVENLQFTTSLAGVISLIFFVIKYSRGYQKNEERMLQSDEHRLDHETRIKELERKSNATDLLFVEIKLKLTHIEALITKNSKQ